MFNWIGLYLVNELIYQNGTGPMYDAVSYTHLDVYKRQVPMPGRAAAAQDSPQASAPLGKAVAQAAAPVSYTHLQGSGI